MIGTLFSTHWNWQRLFSYAEVVCFVTAWALGIAIAMQAQRPGDDGAVNRGFASASDTLGIQAQLLR